MYWVDVLTTSPSTITASKTFDKADEQSKAITTVTSVSFDLNGLQSAYLCAKASGVALVNQFHYVIDGTSQF